jgi:hypothetical protein
MPPEIRQLGGPNSGGASTTRKFQFCTALI